MSIILDALRKSEHQRQRNATPGIADQAVRLSNRKRSPWLLVVTVLVILNTLLLAALWLRSNPEPAKNTESAATPLRPVPPRDSDRPVVTEPAPAATAPARPGVVARLPVAVEAPSAATSSPGRSPAQAATQATGETLPSLETLQLQGVIALPPMRVDLHVYSTVPAERFVFVNMKKQTEGSALPEGPVVEEITPNGVILNWQGERFVMSKN